ncbi:MAG: DHA2 family efflux MFS transporter permease subunit [Bacteroidetes bacterium]|nr:DHA2 family efflux MFS transporter permease subunit [Bacteroidota bacterium]
MAKAGLLHSLRRVTRGRDSTLHPKHPKYPWFVLINIMIGTFMAVLDATIVNVGLPKIMASFGVGIDTIEWVITGYMLAMALSLPTSSWFADRFGYKKMYTIGLALFTFGSFLCGLANEENFLIAARVIQGLGGGFIMPIGMAIVTREFSIEKRGIALGFWAVASAASVSFGPLIGGYLVDNFSWQLIFDVNIPVGIIGIIITIIIQREYVNKKVRKFDIVGFISASVFLPLTLYALSEGTAASNSEGWSAPYILVCFAIAAVSLAVFITNELLVENPLIDLRIFANHNFAMGNVTLFIFGIGMFGSTFLLPLYLQNSLGYTALQSGAVFLPVGFIQGAISPLVGAISDKTSHKIPIFLGVVILAVSFYINSFLSFLTEHDYIMISLYMRGFGLGLIFTPLSTISLLEVPHSKMGQASGLFNVIRQLGGSFGVALLATILTSRVNYHTQVYGESINANSQTLKNVTTHLNYYIQKNAGSPYSKAQNQSKALINMDVGKQAFIQAVDDDFLIAGIITLTGGIPVIFLHSKKKRNLLKNKAND